MRLLVVSHKLCWRSDASPTGFATEGGFPAQMRAIAELFDETTVMVPVCGVGPRPGEMQLDGPGLRVLPLSAPAGRSFARKLAMPVWMGRNLGRLARAVRAADAVHAPIPGDIGTIGMWLASLAKKPLFVRYCGNFQQPRTAAERYWRRYMERHAGGRNVMFATGGGLAQPSERNSAIRWIFSTSLSRHELATWRGKRVPGTAPRLIIVGRQERGKGTDRVLHALPRLLRRWPALHFDVVGEGRALPQFKVLAKRLGVADTVCFHGRVSHDRVMELLADADLFCFPTQSEGFPKAVIEALGNGLPVVTTEVSVLPALMSEGGGVVVKEPGPDALAAAIERCLEPARYGVMSVRAHDTAKRFSLEQWRDDIGDALSSAWGPLRA